MARFRALFLEPIRDQLARKNDLPSRHGVALILGRLPAPSSYSQDPARRSVRAVGRRINSTEGQKNDFCDAEAIAVQLPTMKFVATKTADQLDLQALYRVRERLVSQRTGIINQIRAFLLERGIAVRQGQRFLRVELPRILATPPEVLSPRMVLLIEGLASDWRRLDERIEKRIGEAL
jgi:transposase